MADVSDSLRLFVAAPQALAIPYAIGGSVASSVWGEPRSTNDADLLIGLREAHIERLVARLAPRFFIAAEQVRSAWQAGRSFNVIDFDSCGLHGAAGSRNGSWPPKPLQADCIEPMSGALDSDGHGTRPTAYGQRFTSVFYWYTTICTPVVRGSWPVSA